MGVVTMIESFPARSEACQSAAAPQDLLERLVCRRRRGLKAWGGSLHDGKKRKCVNLPERTVDCYEKKVRNACFLKK